MHDDDIRMCIRLVPTIVMQQWTAIAVSVFRIRRIHVVCKIMGSIRCAVITLSFLEVEQ